MENSILIYEQLSKIGKELVPLAAVKSMIQTNSKVAFESKNFMQIGQETLIGLLSLDKLNIKEIELLAAVSKWVDSEAQRQGLAVNTENRRKVFEPIKSYILFTSMTPEEIANRKEIVELLTVEERGSLVLHLLNKNSPFIFEPKTSRKAGESSLSVFVSDSSSAVADFPGTIFVDLKVNRRVDIIAIYSTLSLVEDLSLNISDADRKRLDLKKMNRLKKDGRWCFTFDPPLNLEPNSLYFLDFKGGRQTEVSDLFNMQRELRHENSTIFNLDFDPIGHCVRGLDFIPLD